MEQTPEIVHQYTRPFYTVRLYPNRIEITEPKILGAPPKVRTILLRAIMSIDQTGINHALSVRTMDGQHHKLLIYGAAADAFKAAIDEAMVRMA